MVAFILAFKLPLGRRGKEERQYKPCCRKFNCSCPNLSLLFIFSFYDSLICPFIPSYPPHTSMAFSIFAVSTPGFLLPGVPGSTRFSPEKG